MKVAAFTLFVLMLTGCGMKHQIAKSMPTAPTLNQFCDPDWVPAEGQETTPMQCKPVVDCSDFVAWQPYRVTCTNVI